MTRNMFAGRVLHKGNSNTTKGFTMSRQSKELSRAETLRRRDVRRRKAIATDVDIERIDVRRLLANPTPRKVA